MLEVNPVTNKLLPRRAFTLRDLILVMREDEIDTAGVNVKRLAKIVHRHRRALDMPARTSASDRRVPRRFSLARRFFPKREVTRVFFFVLVGVDALTRPCDVAREIDLRKFAVLRKRCHAVKDRV